MKENKKDEWITNGNLEKIVKSNDGWESIDDNWYDNGHPAPNVPTGWV